MTIKGYRLKSQKFSGPFLCGPKIINWVKNWKDNTYAKAALGH